MNTHRLETARALHAETSAQLAGTAAQLTTLEGPAHPSMARADDLKRERSNLLTRMLRLGRVDPTAKELRVVEQQIAEAEPSASTAAALEQARQAVSAELLAQHREQAAQLQVVNRELAIALHEAAGDEINRELLPELRRAAARYAAAYAEVVGAGKAHRESARVILDQHGETVAGLGAEYPVTALRFHVVGFGIDEGAGFNCIAIDTSQQVEQERQRARDRWSK